MACAIAYVMLFALFFLHYCGILGIIALNSASQTNFSSTYALPQKNHMFARAFVLLTCRYNVSPGTTGARNFTRSIVVKNTGDVEAWIFILLHARTQAVCAIASTIRTPGITGAAGKCPRKNSSLIEIFFTPTHDSLKLYSLTLSISSIGYL